MRKKILNILELLIIVFVISGIVGFHQDKNSIPRSFEQNDILRIGFDIMLILILLFRSIQIIKKFQKKYIELNEFKTTEKIGYIFLLILLVPDLTLWWKWNYLVSLYLHLFILHLLPFIAWTIEVLERVSVEKNKFRNYAIAILLFIIPVILYSTYLNEID